MVEKRLVRQANIRMQVALDAMFMMANPTIQVERKPQGDCKLGSDMVVRLYIRHLNDHMKDRWRRRLQVGSQVGDD